ncbi:acyl-CoA thioesterase [Azospirillum thiophilum]|nr:acyl-CoA thioesterase [Azospirillum thiophilum]
MDSAHAAEKRRLSFPDGQETRFLEMIFPEQANHYGTLFGGTALDLMGKAAFIAASRAARHAVVMASSEKVTFHSPVAVGQLAELVSRVERVGRSSMTVHVSLTAEVLATGERRLAAEGWFVMVAVDDRGRPVPAMTFQSVQRDTSQG